jgi:hypothetical protein
MGLMVRVVLEPQHGLMGYVSSIRWSAIAISKKGLSSHSSLASSPILPVFEGLVLAFSVGQCNNRFRTGNIL